MPRPGKSITAEEAGILLPGTRIEAKYRGRGTVKIPTQVALSQPHFDEDVYVVWDDGHAPSWLGAEVLQRVP